MNKKELIAAIAEKTEISKKDTEAVVSELFEVVKETVAKGESVQIIGFGSFICRERAARTGKNLHTGEDIQIPAAKVPAFKAGKGFKDAMK